MGYYKPPKVTIGIPTYNQSQYISDALESILSIKYKNLEIIVSDDSTDDLTQKIIQLYIVRDKRIRYERNEKRLGRVLNYHKLLYECATGEYYINLDGDDMLTDYSFIETAISIFEEDESIVAVSGGQESFKKNGEEIRYKKRFDNKINVIDGREVFLGWKLRNLIMPHLTTIYRVSLAKQIGFYEKDISSSDWESLLKLCLHGKVAFYDLSVAKWRYTGDNYTLKFNSKKVIENLEYITSSYNYALNCNKFEKKTLEKWKQSMIADEIVNLLFYYFKSFRHDVLVTLTFMQKTYNVSTRIIFISLSRRLKYVWYSWIY